VGGWIILRWIWMDEDWIGLAQDKNMPHIPEDTNIHNLMLILSSNNLAPLFLKNAALIKYYSNHKTTK
jgi:hypothetical protein